jgi:hypothetical protein
MAPVFMAVVLLMLQLLRVIVSVVSMIQLLVSMVTDAFTFPLLGSIVSFATLMLGVLVVNASVALIGLLVSMVDV